MIRNTLFGLSVLALSAGSAFAAPVKHPVAKTPVVAQADTAAPSGDAAKPAKDAKKSTKKSTKKSSKTEGAKEMKTAAPAPAPATK
jgi:hypothetical protein